MRIFRRYGLMGLLLIEAAAASARAPKFLIGEGAEWRYSAGAGAPPATWNRADFDDSAWPSGRAGFGSGDAPPGTPLDGMRGHYDAVYLRKAFEVRDPGAVETPHLYLDYDDGFVAYLNSERVAGAGVARLGDGSVRVASHEARGPEAFVIPAALLRPGRNVLAIEGRNVALESSDFLLDPFLTSRPLDACTDADDRADLDELGRRLLDQSSYLERLGFDHARALADLRASIRPATTPARFAADVRKLVMQVGDCHASVEPGFRPPGAGFLPIRPADAGGEVVALRADEDRPVDPACPILEAVDGVPLDRWLAASARFVARGSPQFVRRRSLDAMGDLASIRAELGLLPGPTVEVGLRSPDGAKHTTRRLRLAGRESGATRVRTGPTRLLAGNVGYLRIPSMDDGAIDATVAAIRAFRMTKGLIIDVHDNEGGTYGLMRAIYGFFVPADAPPCVTNIAAYRATFRADWEGWSDPERAAIGRALAAFRPEWQPPAGKFSEWHFMTLGRGRSGRDDLGPADYFEYARPVVVLGNAGSFSATGGFLNAFAALPRVTLVGEPSGGGSGATRSFTLPNTRLHVALASMASFRTDGRLCDGRGIEVDIAVAPRLEDYCGAGESDAALARALAVIAEAPPAP